MGRRITTTVLSIALLTVAGCAGDVPGNPDSGGSIAADDAIPAAEGEVAGEGLVLQKGDEPPMLCLGAIAASLPPQCSGPPIEGWDWSAVDQWGEASGVTTGSYAVQGTWDGEALSPTRSPIPLSLFDGMPFEDPREDPATPGAGEEPELARVQQALGGEIPGFLSSSPMNGYLFIDVVFDDGSIQERLDERFGIDLVAVRSALRPVG